MTPSEPLRLSIYGSCVSRDTVSTWPTHSFKLQRYLSRQSLISAYCPIAPEPNTLPESASLGSTFQQKMLTGDWGRTYKSTLPYTSQDTDLILIDLVDERLGVYEFGNGAVITNSLELIKADRDGIVQKSARHILFGSEQHLELWARSLSKFTQDLDRHNLLERVRLIKTPWAEVFKTNKTAPLSFGISANEANELYRPYYRLAENHVQTIDLTSQECRADEEHRWGPAPFHYTPEVYCNITKALRSTLIPGAPAPESP